MGYAYVALGFLFLVMMGVYVIYCIIREKQVRLAEKDKMFYLLLNQLERENLERLLVVFSQQIKKDRECIAKTDWNHVYQEDGMTETLAYAQNSLVIKKNLVKLVKQRLEALKNADVVN